MKLCTWTSAGCERQHPNAKPILWLLSVGRTRLALVHGPVRLLRFRVRFYPKGVRQTSIPNVGNISPSLAAFRCCLTSLSKEDVQLPQLLWPHAQLPCWPGSALRLFGKSWDSRLSNLGTGMRGRSGQRGGVASCCRNQHEHQHPCHLRTH